MQNYLVWRLVLDRISSLSQRFKEARVNYRKVSASSFISCIVVTGVCNKSLVDSRQSEANKAEAWAVENQA